MQNLLTISKPNSFILHCAFLKLAYKVIPYKPCPRDANGKPILPPGDKPVGVAERFGDTVYVGDQKHVDEDGMHDEAMHMGLMLKLYSEFPFDPAKMVDGFATQQGYYLTRDECKQLGFGWASEDFLPTSKKMV